MNYKKISIAALIAMGSSMVFAQDAEIATWAGFRKAAVSFTFDDGPQSDVGVALPMFEKYGYKATFNIVTGWVGGQGMISWDGVKQLASSGHEIASHSDSHPNGQPMPGNEIASSKQTLNSKVQQKYGCITLAYPNCDTPGDSQVLQNYVVGRICNGSWKGGSDIMGKDGPNNWAAVSALMTGNQGTSDFKGNMQKAVQQGGWVAFLTHGFTTGTNGYATYSPTDASTMEGSLQYAQQNDKDIWVAPMGHVAMYIKERKAAKVDVSNSGSSTTVKLTHNIKDNISNYDYPLTLKVKTSLSKAEVTQAGAKLESKIDGGYVYFDAVPNAGDIVIAGEGAGPSPESSSSAEPPQSSSSEAKSSSSTNPWGPKSSSSKGEVDCNANPFDPSCHGMAIAAELQNDFGLSVYRSSDNYIVVGGAQGMSITVFNSLGHQVRTTRGLGAVQKVYTGAKGVYIVKVGGKSFKVKL
ncbi:polysaccharide deacetylase family protein [Fibrobacter sp. UWB5]|uniref:polysaccharide deacetylase family protein n=1 Tax=Fibrobacter sp. UWB5 TaxID=1964360 RepID=UPI000B524B68|nr:polysaccharide deacetylase family protein [Fibrobacter sp. UWB5]OWV14232.1 polysaccharide deacetylase [Fibrobacter sp. UWB5]